MKWGKNHREHRGSEAESGLDFWWGRTESSVATIHCLSGDFYDMGVGAGQELNFSFSMIFCGSKKKSYHHDSGFEKYFIQVKG